MAIIHLFVTAAVMSAAAYAMVMAIKYFKRTELFAHAVGFALLSECAALICTGLFSTWATMFSLEMPESVIIGLRLTICLSAALSTRHLDRTHRAQEKQTQQVCEALRRELDQCENILKGGSGNDAR